MIFDHIGIAVKNIEVSKKMYEKILQTTTYFEETLESQKVKVAFFKTGQDSKIELLEKQNSELRSGLLKLQNNKPDMNANISISSK